MLESKERRQKRLNKLHRSWLEVTGTALVQQHKTDGYKGDKSCYEKYSKHHNIRGR